MRKLNFFFLFLIITLSISTLLTAQENKSELTIEKIMQDPKWIGDVSSDIWWSDDSKYIYFKWNPGDADDDSIYVVSRNGDEPRRLTPEERKNLIPQEGDYTKDKLRKVYEKDGDIFILDIPAGTIKQVTNTTARESSPAFTLDEKRITYVMDSNLYEWNIETGTVKQLTNFIAGHKPKKASLTGQEEWLQNEELSLEQVLKKRNDKLEKYKENRDSLKADRPLKIYVGDNSVDNIQLSPDEKFITFQTIDYPADFKRTNVPHYVDKSGYVVDKSARPKVGSPEPTYELGVYNIEKDTVYYTDTRQIPGIFDKPGFKKSNDDDKYNDPREVVFHGPYFSNDGKYAYLIIRSQDNKDRWIMYFDPAVAGLTLLDRQNDEAWIGGPGIDDWNYAPGFHGWLPDNQTIWFQSEESGYSHLYTLNVETGKKTQLTSGNFEVSGTSRSRGAHDGPRISDDGKWWYFVSSEESPFVRHFYRMPLNGGKTEKITFMDGNNQVMMSPDESMLAIRYSYSNKPWQLYIMENKPGAPAKQVTFPGNEEFQSYNWRDPEIVWFEAGDGVKVPARLYRPETPEQNGPAVIFVHGAGYLQNVHKWWSGYFREYMFHNFLVDNGFTVLDIDYRASAGYGRDWRTAIYRHMGSKDLSDQVDGAEFLVSQYGIDPGRIGIYGGSYGGFITLFAMFTEPHVFKSGAALRSVTDWAHYNHEYTSDILNTPAEDSVAYRQSSPIYFAEGFKGNLLMCHGIVDDNVHFQDIVRLTQRFIELGKENWELAVYPVESHGFVEPSSWIDEYKRIYKLFSKTLK